MLPFPRILNPKLPRILLIFFISIFWRKIAMEEAIVETTLNTCDSLK